MSVTRKPRGVQQKGGNFFTPSDLAAIAELPAGGLCVRLAHHLGSNGPEFSTSLIDLISEFRVAEKTVQSALRALAEAGWIERSDAPRGVVGRCTRATATTLA